MRGTLKRDYWIKSRKKPLRRNIIYLHGSINSKKQELRQFFLCDICNFKNLWRYLRRSYFFTLFQSNYFDTTVTFSEQLALQRCHFFLRSFLFHNSHFFAAVIFFLNSYFFRAKLLPSRHFLRIGSSLGQVLFGTPTFLVEKPYKDIFRRRTFPNQVVLCNIFRRVTFGKSYFFGKTTIVRIAYFYWITTLSEWLHFQKSYFFATYFFRGDTISQLLLHFLLIC